MRDDKQKAKALRKLGKSYNDIQAALGIPKGTLSLWLQNTAWSNKIKRRLTVENNLHHSVRMKQLTNIRGKSLSILYEQAKKEAQEEFEHLKFHPLFLAGIAIYWGEGNKASPYSVTLGNTDPLMVRIFIKFLKEICGIVNKKIRAYVLIYPDLQNEVCEKFWVGASGLQKDNFNKSILIKGRHKERRVKYGVCTITVNSRYLKEKMLEWLRLFSQELIKGYYKRV